MISLIVPSYGGGPNIERTIASVAGVCDDVVIISTALFDEDKEHFKSVANQVVDLPWNFVFLHGYGSLHNQGSLAAKNNWLLLLGVGELLAEQHSNLKRDLSMSTLGMVFRCNHHNDPYTWKRLWNRTGGAHWSGIIHEEIVSGQVGGLVFRMQDTDKIPRQDPLQQEAMRFIKTLSYNHLYRELLLRPERLGGSNAQWLKFVAGASEAIEAFCAAHREMIDACIAGDLDTFLSLVKARMESGATAYGVNFLPQGQ